MIIAGQAYTVPAGEDADAPIFCWDNLVTASNVSAVAAAGYPVTNVANPSTVEGWRSSNSSTAHNLTVDVGGTSLNYIAIAKHNLGSGLITVAVQADDGGGFDTLVTALQLPDDKPAIFLFNGAVYDEIRLVLTPTDSVAPRIAVLHTGVYLRSPRKIYVGHDPITLGPSLSVVGGRSQSGNYQGRIVTGQRTSTTIDLVDLDPGWVRGQMMPFIDHARTEPFFFGWRPQLYPRECGYVWLTSDPRPTNTRSNGMMSVSLDVEGVV